MTATASVSASASMADDSYGWDWSATTHDGRDDIVDDMLAALGASFVIPGKGLQGWSKSVQAFDAGGYTLGSIYFGEARDDVHVLATSDAAQWTRSALGLMDRARTARVDTRVDTLVPFDDLAGECVDAARVYNNKLTRVESWDGQGSSTGRTLYLGAPSSAIRVRVYEKWLESPGEYEEGTNRVEVQLRPPSKVKERVSAWTPAETFCASRVTRHLASALGQSVAPVGTLHVKRGTPTLEQSLESMGHQYGKSFRKWMELSGGDFGKVLEYLSETTA